MNQKISLSKYLLTCVIGFGLGGALWGLVLYTELPDLEYPFHFMAIIIMGLIGGISLTLFSKDFKQISKSVLAGFLGWGVGFILGGILVYPLYFYGGLFLLPLGYLVEIETLNKFLNLELNIAIGDFWLVFLLIGAIIGLFYALFLKLKIWSLIWKTGIGFALGSIIGPIIGNLIGNAFDCLLINYLICFCLMSIILGLFLGWGIRGRASE